MLPDLWNMLEASERKIASPILQISQDAIDITSSTFELRHAFLTCTFVSKNRDRCRFQLSFGKGGERGRFNFFIGEGAEFYNYEAFDDDESQADIRQDLDRFLRSVVRCERIADRQGIVAERYSASELLLDGNPMRFTYQARYMVPFFKKTSEVFTYSPWVD